MQHQLEMHHRLVPDATSLESPDAPWFANGGLGDAAGLGGHLGVYGAPDSGFSHQAKPLQRAFPIRGSRCGPTAAQRPLALPGRNLATGGLQHSEHKLRRKTPSGTIDAGYDGSPAQLIPGQPPFKQVILPAAPWQALGPVPESSTHMPDLPRFDLQSIVPGPMLGARDTALAAHQPSFVPGSSFTDFTHPRPGRHHDSQNRDGFAHILERPGLSHNVHHPPYALGMPDYYPLLAHSPQANTHHNPFGGFCSDDLPVPLESSSFRFPTGDGLGAPLLQPHQKTFPRPTHEYAQNSVFQQGTPQTVQHSAQHPKFGHFAGDSSANKTSFDMQGPNPHRFQQKVLTQAHHTYLELMAQRHVRKANSAKLSPSSGGQSKTFIHPKLPRQFPSNRDSPLGSKGAQFNPSLSRANPGMPDARSTGLPGPFSTSFHGSVSHHSDLTHPVPLFQDPNSQNAHAPSLDGKEKSLAAAARASLEMLLHLCEQSGWKWTDGMLLGGCLCYSIDDYQGALEWFSKALAVDPRYRLFRVRQLLR